MQHCVGHFCRIQKITNSSIQPGSEVGYISLNSTKSSSHKAVQCKCNNDQDCYTCYFITTTKRFLSRSRLFCLDWKTIYLLPHILTVDTTNHVFQYKLLNKMILYGIYQLVLYYCFFCSGYCIFEN